jgi:hypothetical protein
VSLTRWFFRWIQDASIDNRISGLTIVASLGGPKDRSSLGAFLINEPGLIVVGFHAPFWRMDDRTWFRGAIRGAVTVIAGKPPRPLTRTSMMVWSNDETVFPSDLSRADVTVKEGADVCSGEAETVWAWTAHVVGQPIRNQRAGFDLEDFDRWERATRGRRSLPSLKAR